jgi:hypothetical protein
MRMKALILKSLGTKGQAIKTSLAIGIFLIASAKDGDNFSIWQFYLGFFMILPAFLNLKAE